MKKLFILSTFIPGILYAASVPVNTSLQSNVLQQLNLMNQRLQTISQTNANIAQQNTTYYRSVMLPPAKPYPNWEAIQASQTSIASSASGSLANTKTSQQIQRLLNGNNIRKNMLNTASSLIATSLTSFKGNYDNGQILKQDLKPFESSTYTQGIKDAKEVQLLRASNMLQLLNARIAYAKYKQDQTTQKLLLAIAIENLPHRIATGEKK